MDNKQNRQFYWEVKDFFVGKTLNESKKPVNKPNLLKEIKSVMDVAKPISEMEKRKALLGYSKMSSEVKNKTSNLLNSYSDRMNAEKPFSKGNSANYTTNIFNLNEQLMSGTMGPGSSTLSKKRGQYELETATINPDSTSSTLNTATSSQSPLDLSSSFRSLNLNFGQLPRTNVVQGIKTTVSEPNEPKLAPSPAMDTDERMYQGMTKDQAISKLTGNILKPRKDRNAPPDSQVVTNPDGTQVSVLTGNTKKKSSFRV
jgi:hypothetical protein